MLVMFTIDSSPNSQHLARRLKLPNSIRGTGAEEGITARRNATGECLSERG